MIDFKNVKEWWLGQYEVIRAQLNGTTVWNKGDSSKYTPFHIKRHNENVTTDVNIACSEGGETGSPAVITVEQSTDGVNWTTLGATGAGVTLNIPVPASTGVYLRASTNRWNSGGSALQHADTHICLISGSGSVDLEGNIMSLMYGSDFTGNEIHFPHLSGEYSFYGFFTGKPISSSLGTLNVVDASGLILPVTVLKEGCYYRMFEGCTSLTHAPFFNFNTTTTKSNAVLCCACMFKDCTSLVIAPELPFTHRAGSISSPGAADYCYQSMFEGCTSLTTAPYLRALYVYDNSYTRMFYGCTSLTIVPNLPATSLYNNSYNDMFNGCTSLVVAPEIAATTLAYNCCNGMFSYCTALTTPPSILPATTMGNQCYMNMFKGCTSLTRTPILPATAPSENGYRWMFQDCRSLATVTCNADPGLSGNWCFGDWLKNVAAEGIFYKNASVTNWPTGASGIPSGWTVQDISQ